LPFLGYSFNEPTKSSLIGEKSPNLVTLYHTKAKNQILESLTPKSLAQTALNLKIIVKRGRSQKGCQNGRQGDGQKGRKNR
jgi:hypothetical protein